MEKTAALKRLLKYKWIGLLLLAASAYGAHHIYKEYTMPPPLVYLIPEDYFGPVFVFFGQPDGVELIRDPLGHAVKVPENGLVKVRVSSDNAVPSSKGATKQALFWIAISKDGSRRNFMVSGPTQKNEEGVFLRQYADLNSKQILRFPIKENEPPFYYFTEAQKNERMIFEHGGCKHQGFILEKESKSKEPSCGKFLVMSPNEVMKKPYWIWHDLSGEYTSIKELEKDLNKIMKLKAERGLNSEEDYDEHF